MNMANSKFNAFYMRLSTDFVRIVISDGRIDSAFDFTAFFRANDDFGQKHCTPATLVTHVYVCLMSRLMEDPVICPDILSIKTGSDFVGKYNSEFQQFVS